MHFEQGQCYTAPPNMYRIGSLVQLSLVCTNNPIFKTLPTNCTPCGKGGHSKKYLVSYSVASGIQSCSGTRYALSQHKDAKLIRLEKYCAILV